MGPLHIVNKSPFAAPALASCLAHMTGDAALLLIEDGVYAVQAAGAAAEALRDLAERGALYVLAPDLVLRGLAETPGPAGLQRVDHAGFVALVARHSAAHSWF